MQIKVKTGFFQTKVYTMEIQSDTVGFHCEDGDTILLQRENITEVYFRMSDIRLPRIEFLTPQGSLGGELLNRDGAEDCMVMLKREFGRKAVVD
ncbi:MAG: hypothetical protein EOM66_05230 [Clostridia bacterium]|nr:hypothetical protein [Candidatus Pelethousia sp.]NCB30793.1 hypothetical protein [Clostridia bacterium]